MQSLSLTTLAHQHLETARGASSGRSAQTIHGGHDNAMRQTIVALASGHSLSDHESPGEATLQVVTGRVRLSTSDRAWEGETGDYLIIPMERHGLTALEDAVVLLTVLTPTRS